MFQMKAGSYLVATHSLDLKDSKIWWENLDHQFSYRPGVSHVYLSPPLHLGSISPTFLHEEAFTSTDPKSGKGWQYNCIFALLGASRKMLVKLTPCYAIAGLKYFRAFHRFGQA